MRDMLKQQEEMIQKLLKLKSEENEDKSLKVSNDTLKSLHCFFWRLATQYEIFAALCGLLDV